MYEQAPGVFCRAPSRLASLPSPPVIFLDPASHTYFTNMCSMGAVKPVGTQDPSHQKTWVLLPAQREVIFGRWSSDQKEHGPAASPRSLRWGGVYKYEVTCSLTSGTAPAAARSSVNEREIVHEQLHLPDAAELSSLRGFAGSFPSRQPLLLVAASPPKLLQLHVLVPNGSCKTPESSDTRAIRRLVAPLVRRVR